MLTNQAVSLEDFIVQSKGNIVSDMDGEKVMLSIQNGKYYNLGELGGEIWSLIDKPISAKEIVTKLVDLYEVKKVDCEEQVLSFLGTLLDEGLVQISKDKY
ncbi:lasso peptide biosynthesis PqqD family chaperone [Bacillaceae bacterium IKA-2]|nr:lasso peptide biosynthesis PqqD family chaperone [Bacillaceae bacterium IKA-2]